MWYARQRRIDEVRETGGAVLQIEIEQEEDGRWIAEIPALPGVMAYGRNPEEARSKATALALRALADRLEHGEDIPELGDLFVTAA
jgi:predicted RNase H-like HicB family nuclease